MDYGYFDTTGKADPRLFFTFARKEMTICISDSGAFLVGAFSLDKTVSDFDYYSLTEEQVSHQRTPFYPRYTCTYQLFYSITL